MFPEGVISYYFQQGVLGISLLVVAWKYYVDTRDLKKEAQMLAAKNEEKNVKLEALADKRVEEITSLLNSSFSTILAFKENSLQSSEQQKTLINEILTIVRNLQSIVQFRKGSEE